MRLIDADAYAAEMRKKQDNCRAWKDSLEEGTELYARAEQSFTTFIEAALTLKSQPTVDAIPVEWLKNRREQLRQKEYGGLGVAAITKVLMYWHEEQEAR